MASSPAVVVRPHSREDLCMVAPHPDVRTRLLERYNEIKQTIANTPELSFLGAVLKPVENRPPGFNDGLLRPGNTFEPGMTFAAQLAAQSTAPLQEDVRIVNVIVVMVDFSDKQFAADETPERYKNLWFEKDSGKSVRDYYHDVSGGKVEIQGEVVGPFRMPQPISYYANGHSGMGTEAPNARTMARDAAILADPNVEFKKYDNDGDGFVDAYVVLHAGSGAETQLSDSDDIWSHKWVLSGGSYQADGTKIYAYLTVPGNCKLGVCAHELGHLAFGWPDLYDADYTSSGIGKWCLMAYGSHNGDGHNPAPPCAWCKVHQGWVEVVTPTESKQVELQDVKDGQHQVYKLWKDGDPQTEYFLVENRQRTGRDADLPSGGLLLWHIDENKKDNKSEETNYKVGLVQADGLKELEGKKDQGDTGDPFPGVKSVRLVDSTTNPSTNANNGASTDLIISNISDPADVMTFSVTIGKGADPVAKGVDLVATA